MTGVHYLRDSYFSIGNASVANYEYLRTSAGEIQPLKLTVERLQPQGEVETRQYLVSRDDKAVGPFDPTMILWQKKHLFRSLRAVKFSFPLRDHQFGNFYEECFEWQVNVGFQVIESAQIHVQLEDCQVSRCATTHPRPFWTTARQSFVWMHVVVAVVSIVITKARDLLRDHARDNQEKLARDLHNAADEISDEDSSQSFDTQRKVLGSWTKIPFGLKLKLLNGLYVDGTLFSPGTVTDVLIVAVLQAAIGVYLAVPAACEHHVELTFPGSSHADPWGTPRVLQFLLGVSPIFFGYALFGTIYFGNKIEEFGTLSASMVTLFSLMNGDIIMDTFDAMELHHFIVSGKIYLYSFISLFMYVVLNIFIAIVEEAFFATQSTRRRLVDLLADPRVSRVNVAKESDISAEMMRVLLQLMDSE
ncbi:unnamed protein product [Phytophthora lilii]|uniref:Unnamed protein product n=1 Tax=Phytophthora lilii TaxID=2077276 RepID=A0A9W6WQZ6_9STRA|nr:unnamed protein product [Phytophthora lilii]